MAMIRLRKLQEYLLPYLTYKETVKPRIISEYSFFIIRLLILTANYIFRVLPCKWNLTRECFEVGYTKFNLICRFGHIFVRFVIGILLYTYLILSMKKNTTYFDLFIYAGGGTLMATTIVMHFNICWFHRNGLPDLLNGIKSINNIYGKATYFLP